LERSILDVNEGTSTLNVELDAGKPKAKRAQRRPAAAS
jgi:hypothetical protein